MACGKKCNNAPTEEFILESPAPVDVAAKISAIYRELSVKVILIKMQCTEETIICQVVYSNLLCLKKYPILHFQEKERAFDLLEAAKFSEEICDELVSISTAVESPGMR